MTETKLLQEKGFYWDTWVEASVIVPIHVSTIPEKYRVKILAALRKGMRERYAEADEETFEIRLVRCWRMGKFESIVHGDMKGWKK